MGVHELPSDGPTISPVVSLVVGSIGHDLNNVFTAIIGHLQLAQLDLADTAAALAPLAHAEQVAYTAMGMSRAILADVRKLSEHSRSRLRVAVPFRLRLRLESTLGAIRHLLCVILEDVRDARSPRDLSATTTASLRQVEIAASHGCVMLEATARLLHHQPPPCAMVDVNTMLTDLIALIPAPRLRRTRIAYVLAPALPHIWGTLGRLQQIALNLVVNALDAVAGGEGQVIISTGTARLSREELDRYVLGQRCRAGLFVWLQVRDTGSGMDAGMLRHITEPFFTTKPEGFGLGLASLPCVLHHHQGAYQVQSSLGEGTTFTIWLPAGIATPGSPEEVLQVPSKR